MSERQMELFPGPELNDRGQVKAIVERRDREAEKRLKPAAVRKTLEAARAKRDAAIEQVATDREEWITRAIGYVETIARSRRFFSMNDFWDHVELIDDLPPDGENRVTGAVIRKAVKRKICRRAVGRYEDSRRRNCAPLPVWESLVYEGE